MVRTYRSSPDVFPPRNRRRERRMRVLRGVGATLAALLLVAVGLAGWVALRLVRSRALLDGELRVAGLQAPVRVLRDALGVPTIEAEGRADAAFALGFLHAQERFFQMDLLRRSAAGELAALVGSAVLDMDRGRRVHRFRHRAERIVATSPRAAMLETYARGVNAGLEALGAAPFEYLLLRARPEPWRPEDTVLVVFAMYFDLQYSARGIESSRGVVHDVLPRELAQFVTARGSRWDAPLVGDVIPTPPVPSAEVYDMRQRASSGGTGHDEADDDLLRGSNNWAVAGSLTVDGGALLAGDMHLDLNVPNIWYRARLRWTRADGTTWSITGVTLPGTPTLIAGSNGHVTWTFTNATIDASDLVVLEDAGADGRYMTADGSRALDTRREIIAVHGAAAETLDVLESIWGPVVDRDHAGRRRAHRWVAHDVDAVNLGLLDMELADSLEVALDAANQARIPTQNCVVADRTGRIGWTLMGAVPKRFGFDGFVPASWADGTRGWDGVLKAHEVPRVVDPPRGRLWTANARVVDGEALALLGDGGYVLGARARQIRDGLLALERATPHDMLRLQLDDRALFLERWRALLLAVLDGAPGVDTGGRAEMRALVDDWGGRAAVESAGYRIVRQFRTAVIEAAFDPLLSACTEVEPRLRRWHFRQREGVVWALLEARPPHLLDTRYDSWDALLDSCVDATLASLSPGPLRARTWGERNTTRIRHPLSLAVPALSRWLDMVPRPLPGDSNMPRVQTPTAGASQRLVVSPGREEKGFFHMPGGQSGHPWSPFYRNGHAAWERGEATPFLPGETRHTLRLQPRD